MSTPHLYEEVVQSLVERLRTGRKVIADSLRKPNEEPPFMVKLTADEQIEQYFAMTPEKWQDIMETKGPKAAYDYSEAMQKLVHEKYGSSPDSVLIPPGFDANPSMHGPDPEMAPPGTPPALPAGMPNPTMAQSPESMQQITARVLGQVGLDPSAFPPPTPPAMPQQGGIGVPPASVF